MPRIERKDGKQLVGIISLAGPVLLAQELEVFPIQDPLLLDGGPAHVFIKIAVQVITHPNRQGRIKSLFGQLLVALGEKVLEGVPQDCLATPAAQLVAERDIQAALHAAIIEVRGPDLECGCHAHLIRVLKDIVHQESLDVEM